MACRAPRFLLSLAAMRGTIRAWIRAAASAVVLTAGPAAAATYTVNIGNSMDLGDIIAGSTGDTVFRISSSTGAVTVASGGGQRITAGTVRSMVTITCRPSRGVDNTCTTQNVPIRAGVLGVVTGRSRTLTNFTVSMGTATLVGAPSGTSPLNFTLAPPGNNTPQTFYIGVDAPIAGDDSGLPSGWGDAAFYVYALDGQGAEMAGDTDKVGATVRRALAVAKITDLDFGRIQIPSSGTSLVTLDPATGARTIGGSGVGYPTPAPTRGVFNVTGEGGQQISVSVPASVTLSGPASLSVTVTSSLPNPMKLSGNSGSAGSYTFNIGGSFTISPSTPPGSYSGVLVVSVDYN